MFNIHDTHNMPRVLPPYLENLLSERDQILNRLPPEKILEVFDAQEAKVFVDQTLALGAARSGVPVSTLATLFVFLVPALLVSSIPAFIFISWQMGALVLLGSAVAFRAGRYFTVDDVRKAALSNSKLLGDLMEKGVIWFQIAPEYGGEDS